jgi:ABC-type transport system involved in cytochrome bd biosynthesis fused ATPase/permease subunit
MIDKELLDLLAGGKKYVFICAALSLIGLSAGVCFTAGICLALDGIAGGKRGIEPYFLAVICVVSGIVIRFFSSVLNGKFKSELGASVKKDLRRNLYAKLLKLNGTAEDLGAAGLTQIAVEGIEQLDLYYTGYLPQFFFAVSAPFVLFAVCAFINVKAAAVLLACVPLIPASIIVMSKYAKKIFAKYWGKYTSMGDGFLDSVQGLKELKIFGADEARNKKMNADAEEFRRVTMKVLVMQLFSVTVMDLVAFGGAGAGIAVDLMTAGNTNPVSALFLVLIAAEFFIPLRAFGSAFHVAMNGAAAGKKILNLLKTEEILWGEDEFGGSGEIRFEGVSFGYGGGADEAFTEGKPGTADRGSGSRLAAENTDRAFTENKPGTADRRSGARLAAENTDRAFAENKPGTVDRGSGSRLVIEDADMVFENNKLTAIVGESGAGKSTIVKLLTGEKRPRKGQITAGGKPLSSLSRESLFGNLAAVSYDAYIFNDTVRNNFLSACQNASDPEIWEALKKVGLDGFIAENGGLDKPVAEDANNISGGQKQRLALAVNLVRPKKIYVFDEAASNVDVESEAFIMRNIAELKRFAAVILISHRLENAAGADMIYVIKDGRVNESGTHAELMKKDGEYSRLYTAQNAI